MQEIKKLTMLCFKDQFEAILKGRKEFIFTPSLFNSKEKLMTPGGVRIDYDVVELKAWVGSNAPTLVLIFNGFDVLSEQKEVVYPNGNKAQFNPGDFVIYLGDIVKRINIK